MSLIGPKEKDIKIDEKEAIDVIQSQIQWKSFIILSRLRLNMNVLMRFNQTLSTESNRNPQIWEII